MIRLLWLAGIALFSPGAVALSIVCPDKSFPREVPGRITVETDSSKDRTSYFALLPQKYRQDSFRSVELQLCDADGSVVRVPLAVDRTEVKEWRRKLVSFIHTSNSTLALSVEAQYGFPCTWVLTGSVAP